MQTESKPSENNFASFDNFAKLTPIFTAGIFAVSITYDYAYLWALGLTLADIPSSISEHIRSAILWSPIALFLSMTFGALYTFLDKFDNFSNNNIKHFKKYSFFNRIISKYPILLAFLTLLLAIIILIIFSFILKETAILFIAAAYTWLFIIAMYAFQVRSKKIKPQKVVASLYFFPLLLCIFAAYGFFIGNRTIKNKIEKWEYTIKKEDKEIILNIYGQRRFTEFTVAIVKDGKILIIPNGNIVSAKSL